MGKRNYHRQNKMCTAYYQQYSALQKGHEAVPELPNSKPVHHVN